LRESIYNIFVIFVSVLFDISRKYPSLAVRLLEVELRTLEKMMSFAGVDKIALLQ